MTQQAWNYYTPEQYLEAEEASPQKHEYYRGEIYLMAGGSPQHSAIGANVIGELRDALKRKRIACSVYTSDVRIYVPAEIYFTYPDAAIICGKPKLHPKSTTTVENPLLIAEVLSPSSEITTGLPNLTSIRASTRSGIIS
jgi:Uma2 family endonuclease